MKLLIRLSLAAWLLSGCVAGSNMPSEDGPGVMNRDAGPGLCSDGTAPPCAPPRD